MALLINPSLPAFEALKKENIHIMEEPSTPPLNIGIINLMPTKEDTERQFLRMLGSSNKDVKIDLIVPESHKPKNTSKEYIDKFYKRFSQIKDKKYHGIIITGAPVEMLEFEEVFYWEEMKEILDFGHNNSLSTLYICWAAQAALYHFFGVEKTILDKKIFGIYEQKALIESQILNGLNNFLGPISQHTENKKEDLIALDEIEILAEYSEGVFLSKSKSKDDFFVSGHLEYENNTLEKEYIRDINRNLDNVPFPKNYFPNDNPKISPEWTWKSAAERFFENWLEIIIAKSQNNKIHS